MNTFCSGPTARPGAQGDEAVDRPALTVHLAAPENNTGAAVIVNPGGGYRILASDHEGLQVARRLNSAGINAFVLRYRLQPKYEPSFALLDAQRAVRYVRSRARELGVDPNRIGMLGFSAGGHLTTAAGTAFDDGDPAADDPLERVSSRPDFLAPIYAAVSGKLLRGNPRAYHDTDVKVTAATPPAFLVHTHTDPTVTPKHSLAFYQALLDAGVSAEMHIFSFGPHGTGLAPGDPDLGQWPALLRGWLRRQGFLTAAERAEVSGAVLLDGEPLYWGWLTLLPGKREQPAGNGLYGPAERGEVQDRGRRRAERRASPRGGASRRYGFLGSGERLVFTGKCRKIHQKIASGRRSLRANRAWSQRDNDRNCHRIAAVFSLRAGGGALLLVAADRREFAGFEGLVFRPAGGRRAQLGRRRVERRPGVVCRERRRPPRRRGRGAGNSRRQPGRRSRFDGLRRRWRRITRSATCSSRSGL